MSHLLSLYNHPFHKNLKCFTDITYNPHPSLKWFISTPRALLCDLWTILNKRSVEIYIWCISGKTQRLGGGWLHWSLLLLKRAVELLIINPMGPLRITYRLEMSGEMIGMGGGGWLEWAPSEAYTTIHSIKTLYTPRAILITVSPECWRFVSTLDALLYILWTILNKIAIT